MENVECEFKLAGQVLRNVALPCPAPAVCSGWANSIGNCEDIELTLNRINFNWNIELSNYFVQYCTENTSLGRSLST